MKSRWKTKDNFKDCKWRMMENKRRPNLFGCSDKSQTVLVTYRDATVEYVLWNFAYLYVLVKTVEPATTLKLLAVNESQQLQSFELIFGPGSPKDKKSFMLLFNFQFFSVVSLWTLSLLLAWQRFTPMTFPTCYLWAPVSGSMKTTPTPTCLQREVASTDWSAVRSEPELTLSRK